MIKVRAFNKTDREAVRQICCDTADQGESIENIFQDRELAADILTNYYTDYEPESSFVVELEGQVVGYIHGCLDNRRYGLVVLFLILPKFIIKAFFRGVFFRQEYWYILGAMLQNWKRLLTWRKESFHSHQGHMHIGVLKFFRNQNVGKNLVNALLNYAQEGQIHEIIASVHENNSAACHFFEHLGFMARGCNPMVMVSGKSFKKYNSISYAKTIN